MTTFPIIIPSKNRPDGPTLRHLQAEGLEFTVVTDTPQHYEGRYRNVVTLPQANLGIGYARRFIQRRFAPCWMLDDDITSVVGLRRWGLDRISFAEGFELLERHLSCELSLYGPSFAFGMRQWTDKLFRLNRYPSVWVWIGDPARCPPIREWRSREDAAYYLDCMKAGLRSAVHLHVGFRCRPQANTKGGNDEMYRTNESYLRTMDLINEFPEWCSYRETNGDPRLRINFRRIDDHLELHAEERRTRG